MLNHQQTAADFFSGTQLVSETPRASLRAFSCFKLRKYESSYERSYNMIHPKMRIIYVQLHGVQEEVNHTPSLPHSHAGTISSVLIVTLSQINQLETHLQQKSFQISCTVRFVAKESRKSSILGDQSLTSSHFSGICFFLVSNINVI